MTEVIKNKKTRTARGYESIKAGALELPLEERGKLRDLLIVSINNEADSLLQKAEAAKKIAANGSSIKPA